MATLNTNPNQSINGTPNRGLLPNLSGIKIQGYSNTPPPQEPARLFTGGGTQFSMGVQSKSPTIQPDTNTLAKNQTKTSPTPTTSSSTNGTGAQNIPAYDKISGRLTDYGRSLGLPEINGTTQNTQTGSSTGTPIVNHPLSQTYNTGTTTPIIPQSNIIGGLINQANNPSPEYTQAQDAYQKAIGQYNESVQNEAGSLAGIANEAIPLNFQQGRAQVLQNQYTQQQQGLGGLVSGASNALGAANTAAGQQIQAGQSAGGLNAPQLAGYNQQAFNPVTGQFSSGNLQDAVSGVVQKLTSGQMTYNDAVNALSGYGQGGINALQQALPSGFNIAQSNTLGAQQGAIGPAYTYAKQAINNLQNSVSGLMVGQNTNIPIINQITQGLSTVFGVGSQGVQAYKGALAEARSAIQKVLASVQGGTPTDYVGQSNALLPDNATPNQIAAASQTLDTLGQAKLNIYGNPGQSQTPNGTTGGNTIQTPYGAINPNL